MSSPTIPTEDLRSYIRDIPDFPKEGIVFRDLTPLLGNARALRSAVDQIAEPFRGASIDCVLGTEARGFIFGTAVAIALGAGFIPVRKAGKLPHQTLSASYHLEYGTDQIEMHVDGVKTGERVLVVDDLIATGGTAVATIELARRAGAELVGCAFLIELMDLKGRGRLDVDQIHSVIRY